MSEKAIFLDLFRDILPRIITVNFGSLCFYSEIVRDQHSLKFKEITNDHVIINDSVLLMFILYLSYQAA